MQTEKTYCHVGPYPPPLGGVSVYIYRHSQLLLKQGWHVKNIDYSRNHFLVNILHLISLVLSPSITVIHVHGPDFKSIIALMFRPYRSTLKMTDHSGRWALKLTGAKKLLFKLFLKKVTVLIHVGEHIRSYYHKNGIIIPTNKLIVQNAFLPPPPNDEPRIWKTYSDEARIFLTSHRPLLLANAAFIAFHEGVDLYGLDMCLQLTYDLKKQYPKLGMLFALADENRNTIYLSKILKKRAALGLTENFLIMPDQKELWPLFRIADLFVRPTFNDGYGISVAEAVYFGCPAIASDVCARPSGAMLFKNRNSLDLLTKAERILKSATRS